MLNATRKFVAEYEANEAEYDKKKLFDPRKFLKPGFEAITEAVEERIDVFGSEGKSLIKNRKARSHVDLCFLYWERLLPGV